MGVVHRFVCVLIFSHEYYIRKHHPLFFSLFIFTQGYSIYIVNNILLCFLLIDTYFGWKLYSPHHLSILTLFSSLKRHFVRLWIMIYQEYCTMVVPIAFRWFIYDLLYPLLKEANLARQQKWGRGVFYIYIWCPGRGEGIIFLVNSVYVYV